MTHAFRCVSLQQAVSFLLAWSGFALAQSFRPSAQILAQAGPVVFDDLYGFRSAAGYALSGSFRVKQNLHAVIRGAFVPAREFFATPVGERNVAVNLYALALGARLDGPRVFVSQLRSFCGFTGGVLLHRPQAVSVPIGLGGEITVDPPNSTKPLLSAAAGVQWRMSRVISLSLGFEANASRIAERFITGEAREKWRPFYSAAFGVIAGIK